MVLGLMALGWILNELGWGHVAAVLRETAAWFPVIILLEAAWISFDSIALWQLYGPDATKIPFRTWLRSAMVAYPIMVVLPAGRAGGEVARASMFYRHVRGEAVSQATQLQAAVLIANAVICIPCFIALASAVGATHPLALLLAGNALLTLVLGMGIVLALARTPLGRWLERRFGFASQPGSLGGRRFLKACLATSTGRIIQTIQYAVILAAVGGSLTVSSGLISQAIQLVGSGLGDFVPNAVGIKEGAYRIFAQTLGLKGAPERAVAIALVGRLAQFAVAALALPFQSILTTTTPDRID